MRVLLLLTALLFGPPVPVRPALPPTTPPPAPKTAPPVGRWYSRLSPSSDYPVSFEILVEKKRGALSATLVNSAVKTPFTSAAWDGFQLTLEMAHLEGRLVAEKRGGALAGGYTRATATGTAEVPFSASLIPDDPPKAAGSASVAGTWAFELANGRTLTKALGVFRQKGTEATGTLVTATGDYGPLHGTFDGERLVLCLFDGTRVYRLDGELLPDGTLAGEFRSSANPPVAWRGRRLGSEEARTFLPDAFAVVRAKDPKAPYVFSLPDVEGRRVSSFDARFSGKPLLIALMGTWSPSCSDEAPVLRELQARYRGRGLEVVTLTFEVTDDIERNRRQVKRFAERFEVQHPVLLAGSAREAADSAAVAPLEGWEGFPTTLFLDKEHRIVKVHSGFDGPATLERFAKLKKEFDDVVRGLLGNEGEFVVPDATSLGIR